MNRIVVSYGQRNLQKGMIHEQSLPCFLLSRNRLCLLLLVCLFVFFSYFPVVAAFSFLKIPTRVFPMKYLETTYIFFMHIGSSSNSFSLQIEWHVTDMCKHIILVSIDLSVGFYERSYSIQSFKTRCCCFSGIGDSNKYFLEVALNHKNPAMHDRGRRIESSHNEE